MNGYKITESLQALKKNEKEKKEKKNKTKQNKSKNLISGQGYVLDLYQGFTFGVISFK